MVAPPGENRLLLCKVAEQMAAGSVHPVWSYPGRTPRENKHVSVYSHGETLCTDSGILLYIFYMRARVCLFFFQTRLFI